MKRFIIVFCCIFLGLSLRFVNDYLGSNWFNLYLDLIIVVLSIGLFWKKTVWMVTLGLTTVTFLFLIDYQFSSYDFFFIKPMYVILLAIIHFLFSSDVKCHEK